jgi:hypothetical protein
MLDISTLAPLPAGNPFRYDAFHMGTRLGANVVAMFEKFDTEVQPYIILVNTDTGERIRATFTNDRTLG